MKNKNSINKYKYQNIFSAGQNSLCSANSLFLKNHLIFESKTNRWSSAKVAKIAGASASWRRVYDSNNELIDFDYFIKPQKSKLSSPKDFQGTVGLLNNTDYTYHNWLLNELPRIYLFQNSEWEFDWLYTQNHKKHQREVFDIIGISSEKIISINENPHIRADHMLISDFEVNKKIPWACDYIRDTFLRNCDLENNKIIKNKRIYISRENCKSRKIANEKELYEFLNRKYGFTKVVPEKLSVVEQVKIFREAEVILSPHGAALANLVFCNSGTKVVEIFGMNKILKYSWFISSLYNLEYYYLVQPGSSSLEFVENLNKRRYLPDDENISVSISEVDIMLKRVGI